MKRVNAVLSSIAVCAALAGAGPLPHAAADTTDDRCETVSSTKELIRGELVDSKSAYGPGELLFSRKITTKNTVSVEVELGGEVKPPDQLPSLVKLELKATIGYEHESEVELEESFKHEVPAGKRGTQEVHEKVEKTYTHLKCTFAGTESHYFAVGQRKVGLEARYWTDDAPLQRWTLKVQHWAAIINRGGEHCTNHTPDRPDTEDGDEKIIASVEVPYGATPAYGDTADNEVYHDYDEKGHSYQWRPTWLVEFRNPDGTLAIAAQEYPRTGYTQKTLERRWVTNYFDTPMCGHGRGERWLDDEYMYVYRQVANWTMG